MGLAARKFALLFGIFSPGRSGLRQILSGGDPKVLVEAANEAPRHPDEGV